MYSRLALNIRLKTEFLFLLPSPLNAGITGSIIKFSRLLDKHSVGSMGAFLFLLPWRHS